MRKWFGMTFTVFYASLGFAAAGGTISGTIKGPDGAPLKGAFVRAQNIKTKVTTMVLSDKQGRYWADNLAPGGYEVSATSVGYKSDPIKRSDVKVDGEQAVTISFTMQKSMVQWNQLTKYQAGMLLPEAPGRDELLMQCFNCHGIAKFGAMRYDHDGWVQAIGMMTKLGVANIRPDVADKVAGYLAAVFGPDAATPQSPAQLPGWEKVKVEHDSFSDEAMNIVYVDYALVGDPKDRPGTGNPDKDGFIWSEVPGGLVRLNPNTGEVKRWLMSDPSRPSIHEVLPAPDGSAVWLTLEGQNGLARFDTRTEKFETWKDVYDGAMPPQKEPNVPWPGLRDLPGGQDGNGRGGAPRSHTAVRDLDGNIWISGRPLKKFDLKAQKFTNFPEAPDNYGIAVDQQGSVWFAEINARDHHSIGKVDVKTNKITKYTPPNADARPRRLKVDSQGMIWFADYQGGYIDRFDPKSETFKLYKIPDAMPTPYGFGIDKNDNIWYSSMYTDVIGRLDPKTGKIVEYPSPYGERGTRDLWSDAEGRMWYGAQPYFRVGYVRLRSQSEMAALAQAAGAR